MEKMKFESKAVIKNTTYCATCDKFTPDALFDRCNECCQRVLDVLVIRREDVE